MNTDVLYLLRDTSSSDKPLKYDDLVQAITRLEQTIQGENEDLITVVRHLHHFSKWLERFKNYLVNTHNYGHLTSTGKYLLERYQSESERYLSSVVSEQVS